MVCRARSDGFELLSVHPCISVSIIAGMAFGNAVSDQPRRAKQSKLITYRRGPPRNICTVDGSMTQCRDESDSDNVGRTPPVRAGDDRRESFRSFTIHLIFSSTRTPPLARERQLTHYDKGGLYTTCDAGNQNSTRSAVHTHARTAVLHSEVHACESLQLTPLSSVQRPRRVSAGPLPTSQRASRVARDTSRTCTQDVLPSNVCYYLLLLPTAPVRVPRLARRRRRRRQTAGRRPRLPEGRGGRLAGRGGSPRHASGRQHWRWRQRRRSRPGGA